MTILVVTQVVSVVGEGVTDSQADDGFRCTHTASPAAASLALPQFRICCNALATYHESRKSLKNIVLVEQNCSKVFTMFHRLTRPAALAAVAAAVSSRTYASANQPVRRLTFAAAAAAIGTSQFFCTPHSVFLKSRQWRPSFHLFRRRCSICGILYRPSGGICPERCDQEPGTIRRQVSSYFKLCSVP
jgi:hypothetical protein